MCGIESSNILHVRELLSTDLSRNFSKDDILFEAETIRRSIFDRQGALKLPRIYVADRPAIARRSINFGNFGDCGRILTRLACVTEAIRQIEPII
jgi:hypothetical protein